jgi:hypothetical protein
MAIITTAQSGLASDTSTWTGGVVPVEGDKVTITHEVTVDGTYIWGDDTATAIEINSGGTLKASRSTSSSLTVKGMLKYNGTGKHDYGTSSDPIPAGVNALILLNYSASIVGGRYGLWYNNATGGFFSFGANRKRRSKLTSNVAIGGNSFTVDDVTGWEVGDTIVLTPNSVRASSSELVISNISGNTITTTGTAPYAHVAGTRVANFSSNVEYRAYNTTLRFPIFINCNNAGQSTGSVEIQQTLFSATGLSESGAGLPASLSGLGISLGGFSGTIVKEVSNNAFNGLNASNAYGIDNSGNRNYYLHSQNVYTRYPTVAIYTRNGGVALHEDSTLVANTVGVQTAFSQGGVGCIYNRLEICGNSGQAFTGNGTGHTFNQCRFWSNIRHLQPTQGGSHTFIECEFDMEQTTNESTRLYESSFNYLSPVIMKDCTFGLGCGTDAFVFNMTTSHPDNYVLISNKNVDPLQQEIYKSTGTLVRDNDYYRSNSPSVRINPISASNPFSFTINVFAPNNSPVIISGYMQKNSAYGSSNLPSVTLSGLGITPDTFTIDDVDDEWQQFKVQGTQTTGTDGMLNLTFSVQSSAGSVWIDDVVAPVAKPVNVGEFNYWSDALPVQGVLANFVSAADVWNAQINQLTLDGSVGKLVVDTEKKVDDNTALLLRR